MYNKLQYISQGDTVKEQLYNIHQALDHGCDWIQLRFKNQKTGHINFMGIKQKVFPF